LEVLQQQLAALDDSTASELARLIQQSIGGNVVPARQKALLAEALNDLGNCRAGLPARVEGFGRHGGPGLEKNGWELTGRSATRRDRVITGKALPAAAGKSFAFTVEVKDRSSKQTQNSRSR
jgi:hypothetical protein